jgi:adenylate cyclase
LIQLHLLGTLDLRRDAVEVRSVLSQPKRLALLAYLASAAPRGFHSRDTLLALFWPESDGERARNSLRQALHQLRRSLGEDVLVSRGDREVGLDPALFWCDAATFDEAVEQGRHEDALKLYRGDLLPGFFIDEAAEAERWLEEERARRRRAAVDAAWKLAEREEARGEWRAAALWAERAVAFVPLEETALRRLMVLLERAGEPAAALAAFAEFERRLEGEYGLAPSAETLRLVEQLRRPAPVAPPAQEPVAPPIRAAEPPVQEAIAADPHPPEPPAPTVAAEPSLPSAPRVEAAAAPVVVAPESAVTTVDHRARPRQRWAQMAAVAAAVVILLTGGWWATARGGAPAIQAEAPSIAVLPFVNLSGNRENDYFSDGLAEELLNVLAQVPELRVASRTSAFGYRGNNVPVDSIGKALRVGHVLEGSVRQYGSRVRITAQLIDTRTGYHLWSRTYDREMADIFAVQDEISRAIVDQLQVKLTGAPASGTLARQETADPQAHAALLKGAYVLRQSNRESYAQAVAFFEEAIRRDPKYARAYAQLADAIQGQAYRRYIPEEEGYARATSLARRALALDPSMLTAHAALARIAELQWDFRGAEEHYREAVALNPNANLAYTSRPFLLMRLGRAEEAIEGARRYAELVPDRPGSYNNLGAIYGFAGQYDRSLQAFRSALGLDAENASAAIGMALTLSYMGRHAGAIAAAEQVRARLGDDQYGLGTAGYVYARAGRRAEAQRALQALEAQPDASPYLRASVYMGLGDRDRTFALLEKSVSERESAAPDLGIDPTFHALRGDPRMDALLRRIGLPAPQ